MNNSYPLLNEIYFCDRNGNINNIAGAVNWAQTTLGGPDKWPAGLTNTIGLIAMSRFPMMLWWGNELYQFCNAACFSVLGNTYKLTEKGTPADDSSSDPKNPGLPVVKQVLQSGQTAYFEDQLIDAQPHDIRGEIYCTVSYSPLIGETGKIDGVLGVFYDTTQKVNSIKKLSASEKRFQTLIQEAEIGIIVLEGLNNETVLVNDTYLKLVNRNYEALIHKPLFDVIPESEPYFKTIIDKVRTSGEPYFLNAEPYFTLDSQGRKAEGFLNLVYQPHRGLDSDEPGVMVLCHDVTQEVLLNNKLNHREQQAHSLVEGAPFPIGVYEGEEMRITLANQAIVDVWGKGSDIVGKTYFDVLPELKDQEIYPKLLDVFRKGEPFHARNQRVDLEVQGKLRKFYFNYSFTPLFDQEGKIYGVMNTAADVTDLNLAKISAEQSRKDFRSLILQAPVSMCLLLGPSHTVEVANSYMINLWGKQESEVMNKPIFEALPDAREQGLEELLDHVYATGETFTASEMPVHLIRYGNPDVVYQNFIYEPYRDGNGEVRGVIAISNDVTQHVLARQQIEQIVTMRTAELETANENLTRSNEELAQFAYIASHDLQEPLRKISIFSQMLLDKEGMAIDEKSQQQLRRINESAGRMQSLVKDVLAYSQLNRDPGEFVQVNLNAILQGILTDMELLIEEKGANVQFSNLPEVYGQPLQLTQLLSNLIGNALKFHRPNLSPHIIIRTADVSIGEKKDLELDAEQAYVKITVSDSGIGFKAEESDKIFGIFQRLHNKSTFEGTGIGLSICAKIVKNHHGIINTRGSSENGAVFNIYLPL